MTPGGPTELQAALREVSASIDPSLPTQILLLTDANADLPDAAALAAELRRKKARLHLLLIGEGDAPGAALLRRIVTDTGGTAAEQVDPRRWADAARKLMRAASAEPLVRDPLDVSFLADLRALPPRRVPTWNRTWLKAGDVALAAGTRAGERVSVAARRAGDVRVAAAAFRPNEAELAAVVRLVARPPRDPRYRVTWRTGATYGVAVDATDDAGRYLNGLRLSLSQFNDMGEPRGPEVVLTQTGPGRYEWSGEPPSQPLVAILKADGNEIDRAAVAGRYPPEFDAIGNDRRGMRDLAAHTGGAVVEPSHRGPLDLPRRTRDVPLASPLATTAAALLAIALILWRLA